MEHYGVEIEESEGLIDLVRRASEADVSCVLKETPVGTRVSLRSVGAARHLRGQPVTFVMQSEDDQAELLLMVVPPIQKLVQAVSK